MNTPDSTTPTNVIEAAHRFRGVDGSESVLPGIIDLAVYRAQRQARDIAEASIC